MRPLVDGSSTDAIRAVIENLKATVVQLEEMQQQTKTSYWFADLIYCMYFKDHLNIKKSGL